MWMEEVKVKGRIKYKFFERYQDPYTEKLKRVSVTLTSKSNQAKKEATILLQEKIDLKIQKPKTEKITFSAALDQYQDRYKKRVKESSYKSFLSVKGAVLLTIGAETLITNITQEFLTTRIEEAYYDRELAYNTVKKIKWIVVAVMKLFKSKGYKIEIPIGKISLILRPNQYGEKYLEKWELRAIIDELRKSRLSDRKADMVEFLALTGLRYGELVALREQDLFEGYIKVTGTISFKSGKYSDVIRTTPKTAKSIRSVPLSERAIEILFKVLHENEMLKLNNQYEDMGYLFTGENGHPIDYRTFRPSLKSALARTNVDKPVTTHYFRHTHISFLAELGIPLKAVMERVGHKNSNTTLEIYTHVTQKMQSDLVKKLNTIFF